MSKKPMLFILLFPFLLAGCGTEPSWDTKEVAAVSNRIMADNVKAVWKLDGGPSATGKGTLIRLEIKKNDGKPIDAFDINHEKLLHLIVVSKDLSYFNHIHPEYKGNGVFEIVNEFPAGGEYRLIADFKPTGGDPVTKMEWVRLDGVRAQPAPVVPDVTLDSTVNGKRVQLSINQLAAGKDSTLKFNITDEKTNEPVTDLEPYLGAIGHVVVLSEDGERYLHVHAEEGQGMGPEAVFETQFPKSGVYKIWGQFQKDSVVFTVSYVVTVQ